MGNINQIFVGIVKVIPTRTPRIHQIWGAQLTQIILLLQNIMELMEMSILY